MTLARSLRADPLLSTLSLLLVTTNLTPTLQQQLLAAGFDGVIAQPVTQSALYNLVAKPLLADLVATTPDEQPPLATGLNPAAELPPLENKVVLIVDDYENNQRVALAHLKKLGYAAHVVENGRAAVETIAHNGERYALILMDWQMPVMDGLEATRLIRQLELPRGEHIPIIGMTANALKDDRERCLAAGMDGYLSKPVRREDLRSVLNTWAPLATETELA